jgi:hypothetical protein
VPALPAPIPSRPRDRAFLDTLGQRTFAFFWERTDPANGLTPDRWPTPSFSSIAAVGFALTAYGVGRRTGLCHPGGSGRPGAHDAQVLPGRSRGNRGERRERVQGFLLSLPRAGTGYRFQTVELSTVDTALLLAGVLFCREYFSGTDAVETEIRQVADSLYRATDWQWAQPRPPGIAMGWTPEQGFHTWDWRGYNEAMIVYLLALGSPTHPVAPAAWGVWTSQYQWGTFYGQSHLGFAPLFGHQYSHIWVDFRGIRDSYMQGHGTDYYENSRRATVSQRDYAIANPGQWSGYGKNVWGLTASDGPVDDSLFLAGRMRLFFTYSARGASFNEIRDDGTLAPTAAAGSIVFAPEIVIPALVAMRERYGDPLFGQYGFVDAFNPTFTASSPVPQGHVVPGVGWFDNDYLGIDQGPIIAMLENYRTGLVWRYMRKSPYIIQGLRRAGLPVDGSIKPRKTPCPTQTLLPFAFFNAKARKLRKREV